MIEAVYRYPRQSDLDLPVRVRSAGCYRVWSGWSDWIKTKDFLELLSELEEILGMPAGNAIINSLASIHFPTVLLFLNSS